jgi:hypothetical protein
MNPEYEAWLDGYRGPALFQFGVFTLHSGKQSTFKLECDAVRKSEWHSLARIALPILPAFGAVQAVPNGGYNWADIFEHYIQPGVHRTLVVDDVWSTGDSMMQHVPKDTPWHGLVLFARGPVPKNVTALFMLHEDLQ